MKVLQLILFSRKGCCLCEGLEKKLRMLSLREFIPPLELHVVDIDHESTPLEIKASYDIEVPVMVLGNKPEDSILLPRVSPRLNGEGLSLWLQKACNKALEIH